jgi:ornithine cyclodeaminase/alanine dehydrogenase-like protein (mu-crystallin family)
MSPTTSGGGAPPWIGADEVFSRLGFGAAVRAVQEALRSGLDPAADFPRDVLDVASGQLLVMPSETRDFVGVKLATVATVAPGNPALGKARIQGVYVLMDATTLSPVALLDGTAITTLRTPAVSAAAADALAPEDVAHLVVFGAGPQAWSHVAALRTVRTIARVSIVGRSERRAADLVARLRASGVRAEVGTVDAVRGAQLVVCATTALQPLFDGAMVGADACVVAVGSHQPAVRELDSGLMARSQVVVEDAAVALREAGDVVIPVEEGVLRPESLVALRGIVAGTAAVDRSRPRVFKSSGMSWEDLVIAAAVVGA